MTISCLLLMTSYHLLLMDQIWTELLVHYGLRRISKLHSSVSQCREEARLVTVLQYHTNALMVGRTKQQEQLHTQPVQAPKQHCCFSLEHCRLARPSCELNCATVLQGHKQGFMMSCLHLAMNVSSTMHCKSCSLFRLLADGPLAYKLAG